MIEPPFSTFNKAGYMRRTLATMLAAISLLGCVGSDGNGGGSAQCSESISCGGDPVGSWTVNTLCDLDQDQFDAPFDDPECADALGTVSVTPSGSFTLAESGDLTGSLNADTSMTMNISEACLSALAGMTQQWSSATCAAMADNLSSDEGMSASCSLGGSVCSCTVTQSGVPLTSSTSFTITGNELIEDDGTVSSFCQEGDTLRVASPIGTLIFSRR